MISIEDLTDVTLAIEDTNEDDEEDEDDEKDLTDVTLVNDDTYWRLDWCYSSNSGSDESYQGTGKVNRSDEFSEKFQTAFDPPPHFRKVTLRFSRLNCDKSAYVHMEEH